MRVLSDPFIVEAPESYLEAPCRRPSTRKDYKRTLHAARRTLFEEGADWKWNPFRRLARSRRFSYIWAYSPSHRDTFWDGQQARVVNLFEAIGVFVVHEIVPPALHRLRNFGFLRCDPLLAEGWYNAGRVYGCLWAIVVEGAWEKTFEQAGELVKGDPFQTPWFVQGLEVLSNKGLVTYDIDGRQIDLVELPAKKKGRDVCLPQLLAHTGETSRSLSHPNAERVATDCEYPPDRWVRRKLRRLAPSGCGERIP